MHLIQATSREIREEYEALYLKRKKFEKSTPVFSYPLPWTPGQSLIGDQYAYRQCCGAGQSRYFLVGAGASVKVRLPAPAPP